MPPQSPPALELDQLKAVDGEPEKQHSSNLTDEETKVIEKQLQAPDRKIGLFSLLRYANRTEVCIMLVSLLASIVSGAILPLMTLVYGNFAQSFTSFAVDDDAKQRFQDQINTLALYFVYLGIASLVAVYVSTVGFSYTGEKVTQRIREQYLRAIFRQNIAFFDFLGAGEVTTRISSDMNLVRDGVGEKIGLFVSGLSMFLAAIVVGFARSWKLSLIMLSATVVMVLMMAVNGRNMRVNQVQSVNEYAVAGSIAEEVLSSARNVAASGTQNQLASKYRVYLTKASRFDFKSKFFLSTMIAGMQTIMNLQYALAFWQGDRFVRNGELNVGQIMTVVMASMVSGISIGQNLPHLQAFVQAVAAGTKILNTIERQSPIDPETDSGDKPDKFDGNIEFKDVKHIYPSRPDTTVLDNFSLKVPAGKMLALVGASGSGKSTIFGLLERFYLPMSGQILLDGRDISELNLKWLRRNITIVSQEPVLFSSTVYESIAHGLVGTEYEDAKDEVKTELIEQAAKTANAYGFIMDLPEKFQTRVGERGNLLSGGQKQRIAIARAVVSNPQVLLLDEATASLDTRSEVAVQEALDRVSKGRTTIVIAHRLSTIRNADMIVVMAKGKIVEQGTHDELLNIRSVYHSLVQAQEIISKMQPGDISGMEKNEEDLVGGETLNLIRTVTTKSASIHTPEETKEKEYTTWELAKFSWQMNQKEHLIMFIGFVLVFAGGTNAPIQAIFLGNSITALVAPQLTTGHHNISFWCLMFLMLGILIGCFYFVQGLALAKASAKLIATARERAFSAILRQDIEFFDSDAVTSGALASFLSTEANRLAGMSGATLGTILGAGAAIIVAIIVGLVFGWKLALVCISTMPLLLGCGYFRFHALTRMEKRHKESTTASSFACEAAASIRTVASLSLEPHLLRRYHEQLNDQATGNMRFTNVSAILLALSQGLSLFLFALIFWYGGKLMLNMEYTVVQFFVVFSATINGSQQAGAIFSFAPDMGQARAAAALLKKTVDRVPKIDHWSKEGKRVPPEGLQGKIALKNVRFTYPGRPDHPILKGVNLSAQPGQFIALVGASGSGKSTVMALLERFYDAASGSSILVDDVELREYNLQDYRSQVALVSQETTLYTGTIRENVVADREGVDDEAVEQACRDANVYEFIMSLPDGFNTLVGAKGALLSGGQRQRIAIARALLRNPKILLLDEATSSLDSTSERIVQTALDAAAKGRTTVAIAHRLSTIQHADVIFVFDSGRVVERGRHDELMRRKGVYWELARLQDMGAPQ